MNMLLSCIHDAWKEASTIRSILKKQLVEHVATFNLWNGWIYWRVNTIGWEMSNVWVAVFQHQTHRAYKICHKPFRIRILPFAQARIHA